MTPKKKTLEPADALIRTRSPRRNVVAPPFTPERKSKIVPMEITEKSPGSDTGTSHGESSGAHSFIHVEIPTDDAMRTDDGKRNLDDTRRYPINVELPVNQGLRVRQRTEADGHGSTYPSVNDVPPWAAPSTTHMRAELERAHAQAAEHAGLYHDIKNRLELHESMARDEITRIQEAKDADAYRCRVRQHECESEVNVAKAEMQDAQSQLQDIQSQLLQAKLTAEEAVRGVSHANRRC